MLFLFSSFLKTLCSGFYVLKKNYLNQRNALVSLVESLMIQLNFFLKFSCVPWIFFLSLQSHLLCLVSLSILGFHFHHVVILIRWMHVWMSQWRMWTCLAAVGMGPFPCRTLPGTRSLTRSRVVTGLCCRRCYSKCARLTGTRSANRLLLVHREVSMEI